MRYCTTIFAVVPCCSFEQVYSLSLLSCRRRTAQTCERNDQVRRACTAAA